MKKYALILLLYALVMTVYAQDPYQDFYAASTVTNNTGMYILGGWAIANLAAGAAGWSGTSGSTMYFHQMNFFWNTINLGIAGLALLGNHTTDISLLSSGELLSKHTRTENLYLINTGLDVVYMGTGLLLKQLSTRNVKRPDMLKGYGNSVLLQGAFLFLFDGIMYLVQRDHRLDFLESLQPALTQAGALVQWRLYF